ncbi:MAG: hypothetical protein A2748_01065 [Candidatus Wildermuthbacteria bacterium RIFCSPHIGHO2_01_FULL_45_20]|uniref:Uncharacterized protein n=1 Tax=Candidatus Wildermuthbacteria bacterium RIFCSPHIGHO2_02_FULL_45_25 TaxID=1802450 RepID=A0A1G2R0R1_9BACT|nr:MAG: hypothetical protein A3F22_03795 [Candidatus Magasanikbacteria bacterium RIFCSPHIGHO2_12_FULL_41_16]OHA62900.1 MAG: hypothetical protein A2748_01065 [Candidatus Wildermuthbacteria bacterium RIFCSPHIGHO2_01_FULL_45_20]OHA66465.1 MAG: hypothetical protein A3C04_01440 [Candidatus Wildermuthbacteria bacterium RIFCSPHIGHO2_02_FULL_45_25]
MLEFVILFIIVNGGIWIARRSINKRTWSDVTAKLSNGKPENLLVFTSSISELETIKAKLISTLLDSEYTLVNGNSNPIIIEDKKASMNPLHTMYFYPVYFSADQNSQSRIEIGIADKSSFLGSKEDRMKKLQKLFNVLSQSLK